MSNGIARGGEGGKAVEEDQVRQGTQLIPGQGDVSQGGHASDGLGQGGQAVPVQIEGCKVERGVRGGEGPDVTVRELSGNYRRREGVPDHHETLGNNAGRLVLDLIGLGLGVEYTKVVPK